MACESEIREEIRREAEWNMQCLRAEHEHSVRPVHHIYLTQGTENTRSATFIVLETAGRRQRTKLQPWGVFLNPLLIYNVTDKRNSLVPSLAVTRVASALLPKFRLVSHTLNTVVSFITEPLLNELESRDFLVISLNGDDGASPLTRAPYHFQ